jgi:acyl-CoA reductase-like NAD-dependent aldehyde dehydrogenase
VDLASKELIDEAIVGAQKSEDAMAALPVFERRKILGQIAAAIEANKEAFASVLCVEAGKPIKDARVEVARAVETFKTAIEEVGRLDGKFGLFSGLILLFLLWC